jgi:alpha-L-fucosidase
MFKAEHWDPDAWATLFKKAGAEYVMPTAEHHDGFALWDSSLTRWNAKQMGPHRDLIGDLAKAVRKVGLKYGVSNHRMEHYDFIKPLPGSRPTSTILRPRISIPLRTVALRPTQSSLPTGWRVTKS